MDERRGPEYVPAAVFAEKRQRRRRRLRWLFPPVLGVALAWLFMAVWVPKQANTNKLDRMIGFLKVHRVFHAVELRGRPRDREYALRDDYVDGDKRRYTLFNGEVTILTLDSGRSLTFERAPFTLRRTTGALLTNPAPLRLLAECLDDGANVSNGPDNTLVVEVRRRKHEIKLGDQGEPTYWTTYYRTDRGYEILSRTSAQWEPFDPALLQPDMTFDTAIEVSDAAIASPFARAAQAVATIGACRLTALSVSAAGDVTLVEQGKSEHDYFQVTDQNGERYATATRSGTYDTINKIYNGEVLCLRTRNTPSWPLKLTIKLYDHDPSISVDNSVAKVLGTYTQSFERPSASIAPYYMFPTNAADGPYFDYLRSRSYLRATNSFERLKARKKAGESIAPDDADVRRAIGDMRELIRLRAEYDGGLLPIWNIYGTLAELEHLAGLDVDAKASLDYAIEGNRRRNDPDVAAELERIAKETGL